MDESKDKETKEQQESPKVESEPSKHTPEAAEEDEDSKDSASGGWGSWTGGWIDPNAASSLFGKAVSSVTAAVEIAKSKSTEAYGLVSKDLEEVSSQAINVFGNTTTNIKQTLEVIDEKTDVLAEKAVDSVKKSVSSFWRFASGYAQQMFDEEDLGAEALLVQGDDGSSVPLDRLQAQLLALSSDPDTFLQDPDPLDDLANDWNNFNCDLEKRQGEISDLMVSNPHVRKNYSGLVPEKVPHKIFWTRYFYKVHLIEVQERKRQLLKARAELHTATEKSDLLSAWDDEDDKKDIPDDLQDRLLSEYERELLAKKLEKTKISSKSNLAASEKEEDMVIVGSEDSSPIEKDENSSDDWEKLSSGEKSPRKNSKK